MTPFPQIPLLKNLKLMYIVAPNEMDLRNDAKRLAEKWMFTQEELVGLAELVEQGIGR